MVSINVTRRVRLFVGDDPHVEGKVMASNFKTGRPTALALLGLTLLMSADHALSQPTQAQQNALRSNCRSDFMSNCSGVKPGGVEALQCLQRNVAKLSPGCQSAVNALNPPSAPNQATPAPAAAPAVAPPPAPAATPPVAPAAPAPAKTTAAPPPASAAPPKPPARPPQPSPAAASSRPTAQQQAALKQHCQSDFMSRCRGVQPGGADALRCLQRNSAQLSPNCRSAVAALGGGSTPAAAPASAPATAAAPAPAAMPTPAQQSAVRFACRGDFMANCRGVPQGGPEAFACLQRNAARLSPDCRTAIAAIAEDAPTAAPASAASPPGRPVGPLRRAIRERLMNQ
jgi:hypothetical protein